jgi:hypothetical protein
MFYTRLLLICSNMPSRFLHEYAIESTFACHATGFTFCSNYFCRRSPDYTMARLVVTVITGVIFGATWWGEGSLPTDKPASLKNVQNIAGCIYSGLSFMGKLVYIFHIENISQHILSQGSAHVIRPLANARAHLEFYGQILFCMV